MTFNVTPMSDSGFLMQSKPPSLNMFHILNPHAAYALATCCIDCMIVCDVLSHINSAVPTCISLDVVITK